MKITQMCVAAVIATGIVCPLQLPNMSCATGTPVVAIEETVSGHAGVPEASEAGARRATRGLDTVVGSDYLIGPGDAIDISLWKEESLTKSVVVLPDGRISFPLIGQVQASDRTVGDLKKEIEERLKPFVPEPVLSVEVRQVNSMLVYVIGRVNSPGRFVLNTNVNALQALAAAGGLNPFAKRDKIRIMRQEAGKTKSLPFHYDDVIEGKRIEENVVLKRGDLIVVP
jgi:polysaccharide biosynthesis/export protein